MRIKKRVSFLVFLFWLFSISLAQEPLRTWTSSDGRKVEARLIGMVGDSVKIKNTQGRGICSPSHQIIKGRPRICIRSIIERFVQFTQTI